MRLAGGVVLPGAEERLGAVVREDELVLVVRHDDGIGERVHHPPQPLLLDRMHLAALTQLRDVEGLGEKAAGLAGERDERLDVGVARGRALGKEDDADGRLPCTAQRRDDECLEAELDEDVTRARRDPLVGRHVVDALRHTAGERRDRGILEVGKRDLEPFGDLVGDPAAEPPADRAATLVRERDERPLVAEGAREAVEHRDERGLGVSPGQEGVREGLDLVERGAPDRSGHQPVTARLAAFRGAGGRGRRGTGHGTRAERTGAAGSGRGTRDRGCDAQRVGVAKVCVDRGDDDAGLDRDEVDADERDPDPGIDDDPLVQDPVEDIDETRAACRAFNWHVFPFAPLLDGFLWSRRPERAFQVRDA